MLRAAPARRGGPDAGRGLVGPRLADQLPRVVQKRLMSQKEKKGSDKQQQPHKKGHRNCMPQCQPENQFGRARVGSSGSLAGTR